MAAEKAEMDKLKKECDTLRAKIEVSTSCRCQVVLVLFTGRR